ncbi:hypothetical protein SLS62_011276 [Diatrype stigma]|uniref:Uncharacterized protein n=1 Tax=Diatrype stigma TaxID=117547 RepID=A0AAN9U4M4_9PEZI
MFKFWNAQSGRPARVPTDTVVPVRFFDDTIIFRTFTVYNMFVYDDVLDVEKLHSAMTRLEQGELEHHIPAAFTPERPAVTFTSEDHSSVPISAHPVASGVPRPPTDGHPAIVCDPTDFEPLIYGEGVPRTGDDYLYKDTPQLGLRIVSFQDATVVIVHWIHLAFDAMGHSAILKAWQLMVEGREDEIPEPLPADNDALREYGTAPTEPHLLADRRMKLSGLVSWVARNLWSFAVTPKECRMLCVPGAFLARMRAQALSELRAAAADETAGEKEKEKEEPFLSEGDVLLAWLSRLGISHYPVDSEAPVNIQQAMEVRPKMPDRLPPGRPFLGNAVAFVVALLPAKDILTKPLSYVAAAIRRAIVEQGTRPQIEAYGSLVRLDPTNRAPPFFGESGMHLYLFTNWQKAGLFETDLGAAIVEKKDDGRMGTKRALTPSYIQTVQGPYDFPDGIFVVGKDAQENYWVSAYRLKGLWGVMDKVMAAERA